MELPLIENASVKVMRSHDYCHFEVCLSTSEARSPEAVDELRKAAARLADKAVEQYKIAKSRLEALGEASTEKKYLGEEVERILQKPEGDRTPNETAKVKRVADAEYWARRARAYDYENDWQEDLDE